jgi:hypothetical protein
VDESHDVVVCCGRRIIKGDGHGLVAAGTDRAIGMLVVVGMEVKGAENQTESEEGKKPKREPSSCVQGRSSSK